LTHLDLVIPIKHLAQAKRRLCGLLTDAERSDLVLAMLADLVAAGRQAGLVPHVLSPDPDVLVRAERLGAQPLAQHPSSTSLNRALETALRGFFRESPAVLIVLGDTPLATATELRQIAETANDQTNDSPRAIIVSDHMGQGTNALYLRPPTAIPMRFGTHSAARHLAAARAREIPCEVRRYEGLGLDVDTPADIQLLQERPGRTQTQRLLVRLGITERASQVRP
jgi:2-phospho-L-lactate guanylyltransferase